MREEYVAALEAYFPLIPTRLSATFRLDFLRRDAARDAIVLPAAECGVTFEEDAAKQLVDELARISVMDPLDGKLHTKDGLYVEPLHIQVVCESLWREKSVPDRITTADLARLAQGRDSHELRGVTAALAFYYDNSVRELAERSRPGGVTERLHPQLVRAGPDLALRPADPRPPGQRGELWTHTRGPRGAGRPLPHPARPATWECLLRAGPRPADRARPQEQRRIGARNCRCSHVRPSAGPNVVSTVTCSATRN